MASNTATLTIRLPKTAIASIEAIADRQSATRNRVVRMILETALNRGDFLLAEKVKTPEA